MKKIFAVVMLMALLFIGTADAACTQAMSTAFKGNALAGLFQKGHTYRIAVYPDAATHSAATAQYTSTGELAQSGNYTTGGFTLDSLAYGTSGTTYWMDFADEVQNSQTWASAVTCAIIYDDTAVSSGYCTGNGVPAPCCSGVDTGTCDNAAIGVWTFTSAQPSNGTVTFAFPTADASNAVIRIAFWEWLENAIAGLERDGD